MFLIYFHSFNILKISLIQIHQIDIPKRIMHYNNILSCKWVQTNHKILISFITFLIEKSKWFLNMKRMDILPIYITHIPKVINNHITQFFIHGGERNLPQKTKITTGIVKPVKEPNSRIFTRMNSSHLSY